VSAIVVGLGSPGRGDDAVGPLVAAAVAAALERGECGDGDVVVVQHEDPTDLVLAWDGHDRAVVVDAAVSGDEPGTLHLMDVGTDPVSPETWARLGLGGSHAYGLAEAIALARVLGRLPTTVSLVLVEAGDLSVEAPLSEAVANAVPRAVDAVLAALEVDRVPR
jgi:hydrogenase maturation protease